jgi:hypothetical protein
MFGTLSLAFFKTGATILSMIYSLVATEAICWREYIAAMRNNYNLIIIIYYKSILLVQSLDNLVIKTPKGPFNLVNSNELRDPGKTKFPHFKSPILQEVNENRLQLLNEDVQVFERSSLRI